MAAARAAHAATLEADPNHGLARMLSMAEEYKYSKYVRGDNTPACATYLGYLDARELYPDFQPKGFREFAREVLDGRIERPYKHLVLG